MRSTNRQLISNVTAAVHRYEETIGGRPYLIEVTAVSPDRWRAYIVRIPGVPTALMPFYGRTPAEAAHQLSDWLTRAYARAADRQTPPRIVGSRQSPAQSVRYRMSGVRRAHKFAVIIALAGARVGYRRRRGA